MSASGQFLPKSDVCVMSVQLPNNGPKLDVAALRIWAISCREQAQQKSAAKPRLFDHLVSDSLQSSGNIDAKAFWQL
jgi:hypothetical protein